jgi:cysteine desulfurase
MTDKVYLDYNATAPLRPEAKDAMLQALEAPHNASSVHSFGRDARQVIESAREKVAALVGAPPGSKSGQVIFNSGATEGNNTVMQHFKGEKILVSAIEHPAVLEAAPGATIIPVTQDGVVNLNALEDLLKKEKPALVSIMMVNNETGAIQPIKEAAGLAKKHGSLFHTDAVQAVGRIPVDISDLGVDFMTISSHKIGGPQGAGALILGLCGITPTLLYGGGQEKSARAGTENVPAIAGFGAAAQAALRDLPAFQKLEELRNTLEKDMNVHAAGAQRVANTSMFSLPGTSSETLMMALDLEGVAVSNGSACSSGTVHTSHVLTAMGVPEDKAGSAIRVSMGWSTTKEDIDSFLVAWEKITSRL